MESYRYELKMTGTEDTEFMLFKLHKHVPEAKCFIDENGQSIGNDYDWRSLEEDMKAFSATVPNVLFEIEESGIYGDEPIQARYYFQNGKMTRIEPQVVTTWPVFNPSMLA